MTRLPLFGTKIRVAGFGGLRLGEQNALRAIDVFFDRGYVHVNGSWITPRAAPGFRGPVKNHTLHEVPLPKSLMHDELLPRVKELLGLPAKASLQQVINAQEEERQRRASLAAREKDRNLAWWNYPVPPEDELWLFVDTVTGLPVKPEMHNERWHRVRAWVEENDPDNAWPTHDRLPQPPPPRRDQVVPRRARRALGGRRPVPRRQAHHRPQPLRPRRRGRPPRLGQQAREAVGRRVLARLANGPRGRDQNGWQVDGRDLPLPATGSFCETACVAGTNPEARCIPPRKHQPFPTPPWGLLFPAREGREGTRTDRVPTPGSHGGSFLHTPEPLPTPKVRVEGRFDLAATHPMAVARMTWPMINRRLPQWGTRWICGYQRLSVGSLAELWVGLLERPLPSRVGPSASEVREQAPRTSLPEGTPESVELVVVLAASAQRVWP